MKRAKLQSQFSPETVYERNSLLFFLFSIIKY